MTHSPFVRVASGLVSSVVFTALAFGQALPHRAFVSAERGDDLNTRSNCSVAQPCRNFTAAMDIVRAGGELIALDSGGYGPLTITKGLTVTGPSGVYIAISPQGLGTAAITVSTANNETVLLRGLTLTGFGGQDGVLVT